MEPSLPLPIFWADVGLNLREKRGELVNTGMLCDWRVYAVRIVIVVVGRVRIERTTTGLKVRCSTN